mmetsp:Transcript_60406/g.142930  ORF Transcript_60406/g.142930 Transcript_60406/m.142930 type:complete len:129 (+) Transcript_60406:237-623(+)
MIKVAAAFEEYNDTVVVARIDHSLSQAIMTDAMVTTTQHGNPASSTVWPVVKLFKAFSTTPVLTRMGDELLYIGAQGVIHLVNRRLKLDAEIPEELQSCEWVGDECDPMIQEYYKSPLFDPDYEPDDE